MTRLKTERIQTERKCQTCGKLAQWGMPECMDCTAIRFDKGFRIERETKLQYLASLKSVPSTRKLVTMGSIQ